MTETSVYKELDHRPLAWRPIPRRNRGISNGLVAGRIPIGYGVVNTRRRSDSGRWVTDGPACPKPGQRFGDQHQPARLYSSLGLVV